MALRRPRPPLPVPQCGFAATVEGNALTLDQQRAKLELVVETAADLWGA